MSDIKKILLSYTKEKYAQLRELKDSGDYNNWEDFIYKKVIGENNG